MKKNCTPNANRATAWAIALLGGSLVCTIAPQGADAAAIDLGTGGLYTQNFNTLSNTGTSNTTLPNGWAISPTTYRASNGSDNTFGAIYSFGANGSTDRALGSLRGGGSGNLFFGAEFKNVSGLNALLLNISYTGEQWRRGTQLPDKIEFEYKVGANSLTDGAVSSWTRVSALDFNALDASGTSNNSAVNGNAAANRTAISSSFLVSVANNSTFWIRWRDVGASGTDDGLAIDDFNLTAVPTPALLPSLVGFALGVLRKRRQLKKTTEM